MSREIDPLKLQDDLQSHIQRYLLTALPINSRFPDLRKQAEDYLSKSDVLVKGPYIEAIPDFPKGSSLQDLVEQGVLHRGFESLGESVYRRKLHSHQERAIKEVVSNGKNIVVATGTGSGKTECFFYPLIDALLKDDPKDNPGIRAIIVYPLNALANDQLYQRLAPVLAKQLEAYGITVGRYTGQTKPGWDRTKIETQLLGGSRFLRETFGRQISRNWLLSRDEMLETPPHVLVTNYAMLEHLLLLPRNRGLFKNVQLKFLILDELHSYAGTQATEVALLIRKLVSRYAPDQEIRCIGTSASLSSEPDAQEGVKKFAGDIFGTPFELPITATRVPHRLLVGHDAPNALSAVEWQAVLEIFGRLSQDIAMTASFEPQNLELEAALIRKWNEEVANANVPLAVEDDCEILERGLAVLLGRDPRVKALASLLAEKGTMLFSEVATQIFGVDEPNRLIALRAMVTLGVLAREQRNGYPLLPARYHIFTKGVEEATIELASNVENATRLKFTREFFDTDLEMPRYRLLTCRKCGELYFEGWGPRTCERIQPERGRNMTRHVFWLKPKDSCVAADDDDELDDGGLEDFHDGECYIHTKTGECVEFQQDARGPGEWIKTWRAKFARSDEDDELDGTRRVTKCRACGGVDRREIVTPFDPSDQTLSAAICERLYAPIPERIPSEDLETGRPLPGGGRSLLVFSDNRQDAAFFAPNLQRRHEEALLRRHIVNQVRGHGGDRRLDELPATMDTPIFRSGFKNRFGERLTPDDATSHFHGLVAAEFCTPGGARSSLEDLAIIEVHYGNRPNQIAELAGLEHPEAVGIVRFILDVMRSTRAIKMPQGISPRDEFFWGDYNQENRYYRLQGDSRFKFLPGIMQNGNVRSNRFVFALRDRLELQNWQEVLCNFWNVVNREPEEWGFARFAEGDTTALVMRTGMIHLKLPGSEAQVYRCNKCGVKSFWTLANKCMRWKCLGEMQVVEPQVLARDLQRNYYHGVYRKLEAIPTLIAAEHTAALGTDLKQNIEGDFKAGKINVLSCSTTMEMGIDLGELSAVMMRNLPPGIANYQQRAGRAGRRGQGAPVSLTFARNRRYDQTVYDEAEMFLSQAPRTPFVHLSNDRLLLRHQFSILLSDFLAHQNLQSSSIQIGELFGLPAVRMAGDLGLEMNPFQPFGDAQKEDFVKNLRQWVSSEKAQQALQLSEMLHQRVGRSIAFDGAKLKLAFVETLAAVAEQFSRKYSFYWEGVRSAAKADKHRIAGKIQNQACRFAHQQLIKYLSKHGAIPTYSFPVDCVELEVLDGTFTASNQERDVELVRDARVGIVEYAPDSEVVAKGRVWISRGIDTDPRQYMPRQTYKICGNCRHVEQSLQKELLPDQCPSCGSAIADILPRSYVEPISFVTSVDEKEGFEPGRSRIKPPGALEQMLIQNAPEEAFEGTDLCHVSWAYQDAHRGRMVIINQGRGRHGFLKCNLCAKTTVKRHLGDALARHKNPKTGVPCNGNNGQPSYSTLDLGHTFHTDVLQMRIGFGIPVPDHLGPNTDPVDFRGDVARTVVEGVRLAAVEILDIPDGEITASFRWTFAGGLEVVLSDSVSGGAGYVGKIKDVGANALFKKTAALLACPKQCTTGCASCLRSYSNQFYWDRFRRQEALNYVNTLLAHQQNDPLLAGARKLTSQQFRELLGNATEIIWLSPRLGQFSGTIPLAPGEAAEPKIEDLLPGAGHLRVWLASKKSITLTAALIPNFKSISSPRARRFCEAFSEDLRTSGLKLGRWNSGLDIKNLPLAIVRKPLQQNWSAVYTFNGRPGLVDCSELPDNVFEREWTGGRVQEFVGSLEFISQTAWTFDVGDRIEVAPGADWEGQLVSVFKAMLHNKPTKILIHDKYALAQPLLLMKFVDSLKIAITSMTVSPPVRISINAGPYNKNVPNQREDWLQNKVNFTNYIKQETFWQRTVFDVKFREHSYGAIGLDHHDRIIECMTEEPNMQPSKVILELTNGIDALMSKKEKLRVYVLRSP